MTAETETSIIADLATPAGVVPEGASRPPVLITEQEVFLSTAAAVPLRKHKTAHQFADAARGVLGSLSRVFSLSAGETRPSPRDFPSRLGFLEHSAMAREMDRL
ncbi:MAG: hypothetical protein QOE41_2508 [Mycobacterium sp.]|jgi:hypothetical protein|nr:hypothetical protein [Mycobacterium sp.]MDT5133197.1 hypothetical protein [Mycobacterium sp.]